MIIIYHNFICYVNIITLFGQKKGISYNFFQKLEPLMWSPFLRLGT